MWGIRIDRSLTRILAVAALPLLLLVAGTTYLVRLSSGGSAPAAVATAAPAESSAATSDAEPSGTASTPPDDPPTDVADSPPANPPDPATTGGQPPPPSRASITVGGVRLDNSVPTSDTCVTFANTEFGQPVDVVDVSVADGPAFMVVDDSRCRNPELLLHPFRPCPGATLEPGGPGCDVGVGVSPDGPPLSAGGDNTVLHNGTIQLRLRTTCTSRAAEPCASLDDRYSPSAAAPVEVTWTDPGRVRTVAVEEAPAPEESETPSGEPSAEASEQPAG